MLSAFASAFCIETQSKPPKHLGNGFSFDFIVSLIRLGHFHLSLQYRWCYAINFIKSLWMCICMLASGNSMVFEFSFQWNVFVIFLLLSSDPLYYKWYFWWNSYLFVPHFRPYLIETFTCSIGIRTFSKHIYKYVLFFLSIFLSNFIATKQIFDCAFHVSVHFRAAAAAAVIQKVKCLTFFERFNEWILDEHSISCWLHSIHSMRASQRATQTHNNIHTPMVRAWVRASERASVK